jgi:thiamine-monophosphate kinase
MRDGERELIRSIRKRASAASSKSLALHTGIGDDCAVLNLSSKEEMLVTTDLFLEGVHFRRGWQTAHVAGQMCLTRGLSDIAAMGGRPVAVFLSLACPKGTSRRWISAFVGGVTELGEHYGAPLAGGDTAAAPEKIIADIVVIGAAPKGEAVLRSGAKSGDRIYVTGTLGGARAELSRLLATKAKAEVRCALPQPQLEAGQKLRGVASAMIDTSDGLSVDLAHICEESRVSAIIEATQIPIAPSATLEDALHGGEDYQLLFVAPRNRRVPVICYPIGEIVPRRKHLVLLTDGKKAKPLPQLGWQHRI